MKSLTYDKNIITGKYATSNVQMLWKLNYCESDAITKDLSDKLFSFFFLSKYACRPYWYFVITIGNRQIEQANGINLLMRLAQHVIPLTWRCCTREPSHFAR